MSLSKDSCRGVFVRKSGRFSPGAIVVGALDGW
jgi:hypothetical protein